MTTSPTASLFLTDRTVMAEPEVLLSVTLSLEVDQEKEPPLGVPVAVTSVELRCGRLPTAVPLARGIPLFLVSVAHFMLTV
jgi:hypothetical protein